MKPRAWCLVKHLPPVRGESFAAGLRAAGLDLQKGAPSQVRAGDVLVTWNRFGPNDDYARAVERAGGIVLVAENGYLGPGGSVPKFDLDEGMQAEHYLALGRGAHNDGAGAVSGGPERFAALGVELKPWRADSGHILVCPNRSFGPAGRIQACDWSAHVCTRLKRLTRREIRVRPHPGTHKPARDLAVDLEGCWAVVIWHSSAGIHALVAGVPVLCDGPAWSLKECSGAVDDVETPPRPERLPHFERLAWMQWTFAEIATGEPIRRLLDPVS